MSPHTFSYQWGPNQRLARPGRRDGPAVAESENLFARQDDPEETWTASPCRPTCSRTDPTTSSGRPPSPSSQAYNDRPENATKPRPPSPQRSGIIRSDTVSPGANAATNTTRHATGSFKLVVAFLRRFGRVFKLDHPVEHGVQRYLDVLHGDDTTYLNGGTYTSRPTKATGPLDLSAPPHLTDVGRQDTALAVPDQLAQQPTEAS